MMKSTLTIVMILVSLFLVFGSVEAIPKANQILPPQANSQMNLWNTFRGDPIRGCTVFTLSRGNQVFFGGNDDYIEPDSYYWVDQAQDGAYGAIWIGTPDNVQQGVNEMGLAYDANGLPRVDVNPHSERTPFRGGYNSYPIQILRENASVAEVIEWVRSHEWRSFMHDQMHFADASGDAVIISAGPDGELVFTRKPVGDSFLVSTNFNIANPSNSHGYPCWRFDSAQRALEQLMDQPDVLTAADVVAVLDSTHVEAAASWTIGSLLADLSTGTVYLYYFHQFDQPVVLNVAEQLANPPEPGPLSLLFPEQVREEAERRYQQIQSRVSRSQWLGVAWLGTVLVSLVLFFALSKKPNHGRGFWVVMLVVLGPLALLIWRVAGRREASGVGRTALLETLGDVTPTAVAYLAMLVLVLLVPRVQSSDLLQIALIIGLPLLAVLFLFHGPLLASATKIGYLSLVRRKLPHAIVSANLGMAGVNAIATPLMSVSLSSRAVQAYPVATVGFLLMAAAVGALAGIGLVWIYNLWTVQRGSRSWSALISDGSDVEFLGWRRLGWWILLSFIAQIGGIVASVTLQGVLRG
ncbi:hypothetical protein ACFLSZ_06115 [Candidatus Bipolaricaulota bacterium]